MRAQVRQFMASFIKTFCIMNFVVGTAAYILVPGTVSPVPGSLTMGMLGIITGILACAEMFHKA